ncbi:MAG: rod shape-determining protein MreC, partial [Bacteroidales bacterium]
FFFIAKDSLFQQIKISGAVMYLKGGVSELISDTRYFVGLKETNYILLEENLKLKNNLEKLRAKQYLTDTLPAEKHHKEFAPKFSYLSAKIISNSTNKLQNYLILDKGRAHGVTKDMGVISPLGIVGIVSSVSDNFSYVISFLNTTQSVSAKLAPSQSFGPLVWEGRRTNYATLTEIPYHVKFMVGDTVYTSGFSTMFPPDIPLGTARKSSLIKGAHHKIQVRLFQDFNTLHYVNIVINNNKRELEQIIKENEVQF